jgi:hypothetical protein
MVIKPKSFWLQQKWGTLVLDRNQELPNEWSSKSHKIFTFICDCGNSRISSMQSVTEAKRASCGTCNYLPKIYWLAQRWGELRLDPNQELPEKWPPGSNVLMWFLCSCSRRIQLKPNSVRKDYTSCGHCEDRPKEYWLAQRWGELRLDPNQELPYAWGPMSQSRFNFICMCGRVASIRMCRVMLKSNTTCGKCNVFSKQHWLKQQWGRLRLVPTQSLPEEWSKFSVQKFWFLCTCGREAKFRMNDVCFSCGKCDWKLKDYWLSQVWGKLKIDPSLPLPEEWGAGGGGLDELKMQFLCECGKTTNSTLGHVIHGDTHSCGCVAKGKSDSSPAYKIYEFVKMQAPDAEFSYWFNTCDNKRREYDIYIPSKKLAIEYHGLIWHSEKVISGTRDYNKYQASIIRYDRLIQVYQDEWENKQDVIKQLILQAIDGKHRGKGKRVVPSYSVEYITPPEARSFLDAHHYLGAASGCLTVIARHGGAVVGVWVFMKREKGVVIFHRASWDSNFKAWNPHQKALKLAIPELKSLGFNKIVTFSDNRLFTGAMYPKLGFSFEKELPPDYSYTNGIIRKSKYTFRVRAGVNEKSEAEAKGWYRIWDSGKKRFSLSI